MLSRIKHTLESMTKTNIKCAQQNRNIPTISQDPYLNKQNEIMLNRRRMGELDTFKAFGYPLNELKKMYIRYLKTKLNEHDVKLI